MIWHCKKRGPAGAHAMRRPDFITLLGGAAAAWPLAARSQQPEQMRRIGVLMNTTADDPPCQARIAAFHQGLQQLGWAARAAKSTAILSIAGAQVTRTFIGKMCQN